MTTLPQHELAPTVAAFDVAPRVAFDQIAEAGFLAVQLSAAQAGMRPRELDRSGRRDVLATLRRRGLAVAGLDLWIPPAHLLDPVTADRAVGALLAAIELAADLGRVALSLAMPRAADDDGPTALSEVVHVVVDQASRAGVPLADHADPLGEIQDLGVGLDPAACLARGQDPIAAAAGHATRLRAARLVDLLTSGARGPVGDPQAGQLDVVSYRAAIGLGGYLGPVVIDARDWPAPWDGIRQCQEVWTAAAPGPASMQP